MRITLFLCLNLFCLSQSFSQITPSKTLDKKGQLTERCRVNYFGKIESDFEGIAVIRYEYDRKGNLTRKSNFDKNNNPYQPDTNSRSGNPEYPSYTIYQYESNKLIKVSNHNANGTLLDLAGKPAIKRYKYDGSWRLIEEANFDKYGRYTGIGRLEVAYTKYSYNYKNLLIEEKSFDKNKKILDFGMNYAKHTYDSLNRRVRTSYFFANSDLYHTDLFYYDSKGQMIKEDSYNKLNKLEYTIKFTYDYNGQVIKKIFEYPDGTKNVKKNGIELDINGWKLTSAPTIKGITDVDGYGSFLVKIDKDGKIIELKNSSCSAPLAYALIPFLREIKISRDPSVKEPFYRGEIRVGVLNIDPLVEEF